jgi:death-on-curing protein
VTASFLTVSDVLAIHADQIERFGGAPGLRDPALLAAALQRPQRGFRKDAIEEATVLWESLWQDHPFIDANDRVAFAATHAFLAVNGISLTATSDQVHAFIAGHLDPATFNFSAIAAFLRAHI